LMEEHLREPALPKAHRFAARPTLTALLPAGIAKSRRNAAIVEACRKHGYTMAEVAAHIELHYSSVFRITQSENDEKEDLTPALQRG
jgi:hypothetical protein